MLALARTVRPHLIILALAHIIGSYCSVGLWIVNNEAADFTLAQPFGGWRAPLYVLTDDFRDARQWNDLNVPTQNLLTAYYAAYLIPFLTTLCFGEYFLACWRDRANVAGPVLIIPKSTARQIQLRPFGLRLPSDRIAQRFGIDENEPHEVDARAKHYAALGVRSTFVINTWYEEIAGGYYENRALYLLIDQALRSLNIYPVIRETYRENGLVPIEGEGQLWPDDEYVLVAADQSLRGFLQIWKFSVGGGGPYYGDDMVFDFILPEEVTRQLVDEVERRCQAVSVPFSRKPDATPIKKSRWAWLRR